MNTPFRQTFAIPAACSPVNELLTAIMRSFNEQPEQPREQTASKSADTSKSRASRAASARSTIRNPQF